MTSQHIFLLVASLAAAMPAQSQPGLRTDTLALTLADALGRLARREPRLAAARAMRDMAQAAQGEALSTRRNRVLPVVSAAFGTQRLAQNQFLEIGRRAGVSSPPTDQLDPFSRVFTSPNTRTASLTAAIRPYDGGVADAQVDAARAGVHASDLAALQVRAALEAEVVTWYADVQLQRRLREVADSAIAHAERILSVTRQAVARGRTPEFEIWRVEADVQAVRSARFDADRQLRVTELALRQLIEVPEHVPLRLDTPAEPWSAKETAASLVVSRPDPAAKSRVERLALRELDAREREAAAQRRAAWRALLPALDVTLSHQRFAYPLRGSDWGGPFYQNTQVGVSFSVPLDLTGGSVTRIESAAARVRLVQAQRRDAERLHALEATDMEAQRDATRAAWLAAVAGSTSAEKTLRVAQARHDVGRASLLELQDARLVWYRSMATRAQAARDRTVIEARLDRLDRLPLSSLQN